MKPGPKSGHRIAPIARNNSAVGSAMPTVEIGLSNPRVCDPTSHQKDFSRGPAFRGSQVSVTHPSTIDGSGCNKTPSPKLPEHTRIEIGSASRLRERERGERSDATMPTGRLSGNITQDWEPVVLRRTKPKAADLKSAKAVNQALRSGAAVETVRKSTAGTNKHAAPAVAPARKLDETTEPAAVERVATEVRAAIQKARVAKGWSQAELAKRINERAQVVQEYESGKAAPAQAVLAKMERALEVKLRGKGVGAPLAAGGGK
ncbi:hypothetical protein HU200_042564 [Digitaria exilis]|uniref:HTH cro/C1-type domain-containing protein n=1 Tax=Digitaria exilis TaxID=1010633 RepID=A0A835EGV2_9POAL|nr:hypothetical protein HU200_042564 [Digitaria exilis]